MARRNNKGRTSSPAPFVPEPPQQSGAQFDFANPTEFVELPSKGRLYPPDHPFHMKEEVEIKFMTAKEEDILSSKVLLSKGLAFDRLLQSLIIDDVDIKTLIAGDKNALLIAARITGYGSEYPVTVTCPNCNSTGPHVFDLESLPIKYIPEGLDITPDGTYATTLPKTGVEVEIRYLNSKEQEYLTRSTDSKVKNGLPETSTTDFLKMAVVSVQSETKRSKIDSFIMSMPSYDSLHIRKIYNTISPNIEMKQDYQCSSCGTTTALEVPLGSNFFWPN